MLRLIANKQIDKSEIKRILIRSTNWVGDVVMTLPALESVRENFPESHITVLAKPWVIPLFEKHPSVDDIITFDKGDGYLGGIGQIVRIIRVIRKKRFDLAIIFQNAFEAALLAFLGNAEYRLGYKTDGRGFFLTHKVVISDEILKVHQVEYYLGLLRAMGWQAKTQGPALYVDQKNIKKAKGLLDSCGIVERDFVLGLSPGAIFGEAKRWPADRFARIGDLAIERWGAKVMILGSRKEMDICEAVCGSMTHSSINLCGRTSLGEVMGLIGRSSFFVTNDSGLMHISAALGIPTVAIFGSTDPIATGPRGPKTRIVRHEIECAPCLKPECPSDNRCLLDIGPEEVWDEMNSLKEA